jgi:hypothetical protein
MNPRGKKFILLVLIFSLMMFSANLSFQNQGKDVVCVVERFANYVFHLLAVAKISYNSEYADMYRDTIIHEDLEYLEKQRSRLQWGRGKGGVLTPIFMFIPVYINLYTEDELAEYFSFIDQGIEIQDSEPTLRRYGDYFERLKLWFMPEDFENNLYKPLIEHREVIRQLGEIYKRNYPEYIKNVWPKERRKVEGVAQKLNFRLKEEDLITKWEKLTGMEFKFPRYEIVLVSAAKNGPSANSLGYERNLFYADPRVELMVKFISHEVGTHILCDLFKKAQSRGIDYMIIYKAHECLNMFYNKMFYPEMEYNWSHYDEETFLPIYKQIYDENSGITASELFNRGLGTYLERRNRVEAKDPKALVSLD